MANINVEIAAIQEAARGSEVRQPMVSALNKINAETLPAATTSRVVDEFRIRCSIAYD